MEAEERFPVENIRQYNKINEGFLDLANKRVDAIIIDVPVAERYIEIKGGCKTVGGVFTEEYFGIAVSKENPELLEEVDRVLADQKKAVSSTNLSISGFNLAEVGEMQGIFGVFKQNIILQQIRNNISIP